MEKLKQFALVILIPVALGIVGFFGNFFFFEYQTTKASVLLNETKLIIYNAQIESLRSDLKSDINEVKDGQKQIINILLERN